MEKNSPPNKLAGNGPGGFEELLMTEATRLDAQNILTMSRYPVASVMLPGSKFPIQKPSLPDFEGVFPGGRQFVIEAKVCSQASFPVTKAKLKPKQIRHMLTRSRFGVPCFLLIHFNAREGKTFRDEPFTVGIPVMRVVDGGVPLWEEYAVDPKGGYSGVITRDAARAMGTVMEWHTPKQCRSPRPNLQQFLSPHA